MANTNLAEVIRTRLGECSPAERKVGRALLADFPAAGLETVARLAERAQVSGPTVVRFATRLGFTGFPHLQEGLRATGRRAVAAGSGAGPPGEQEASRSVALVRQAADAVSDALLRTFAELPPYDLQGAIGLLADRSRRLHLLGDPHDQLLVAYLARLLIPLRDGVHLLADMPAQRAAAVSDLGGRDVLVVCDFRPYDRPLVVLARQAVGNHVKVILFTDARLSPVAAYAEVVLPIGYGTDSNSTSNSTFASSAPPLGLDTMFTPAVAVVEALATGVLAELGAPARARVRRTAELTARLTAS